MVELLRPDVAIVTLVDLEHKSLFRSREAVAAQKAELVVALQPGGLAILNGDDPLVMNMARRTSARVVTFGGSESVDYSAVDIGFPERMTVLWSGGSLAVEGRSGATLDATGLPWLRWLNSLVHNHRAPRYGGKS